MDPSLVDALLGLALAYSATYVLYCWMHSDRKPKERGTPEGDSPAPGIEPRRNNPSHSA